MTICIPTFATFDLDTGGAVATDTGETPALEYDHRTGRVKLIFFGQDAPKAAEAFRRDHRLQAIFNAKRELWPMMKDCMRRGRGQL